MAYGSAASDRPAIQGLNAMLEVCIVSFVTSTISAMTILLSGVLSGGATSTTLVAQAFASVIPGGGYLVLLCAFLFGFSTLIGWGYYGEQFLTYLAGRRIVLPYRWIYCLLIVPGGDGQGRAGVGLGRPDERPADLPQPGRACCCSPGVVAKMLREDRGHQPEATAPTWLLPPPRHGAAGCRPLCRKRTIRPPASRVKRWISRSRTRLPVASTVASM